MTTLLPLQTKSALTLVSSERLRRETAVPPKAARRDPLGAAAKRLLDALAGEQAYGFLEGAEVTVTGLRRGVSLKVASAPVEVAQSLVDRDLATWREPARSGRQRLLISAEGRAWRSRAAAPQGVDPFLAQHRPVTPGQSGEPAVDGGESPLTWLATRKGRDGRPLIDATQLEAGERLRRDLTVAAMVPRVTANWGAPAGKTGGGAQPFPEVVLAARQRATRALDAVGPAFNGLLMDVCGFLKGLEHVEAERGWPARSGKVVLVLALNQLARHYGLASAAVGPARSRGVRHWGADDYRPTIGTPSDEP